MVTKGGSSLAFWMLWVRELEMSGEPRVLNFNIWRTGPNQGSLNKEVVIDKAWKYGEYSGANSSATGHC